jgi:hypothetical protein
VGPCHHGVERLQVVDGGTVSRYILLMPKYRPQGSTPRIFSICFFPSVSASKFSHPYKTTGKFIVVYILIFIFLGNRPNGSRNSLNLIFNFFRQAVWICYCHCQIFEMMHMFEDLINCLYLVTLSCISCTRHEYTGIFSPCI